MHAVEAKLRDTVRRLFSEGRVDAVVGFERGSAPHRMRPCIVRRVDDVDKLVWNGLCRGNLATFLPRLFVRPARASEKYVPPRVGIVARACDARSVIGLVKENQVPRQNVVIIGMPCEGVLDPGKAMKQAVGAEVLACEECDDGSVSVTTSAGRTVLKREALVMRACTECAHPVCPECDILIEGISRAPSSSTDPRVAEHERKSAEERWQQFVHDISKCIRCNACREACPNCYCKTCFADQTSPSWLSAGDRLSDTIAFHMGRMFHQAGRCVECDACVYACPMGIDLRLYTQKLASDARDLYGSVPGLLVDEPLALGAFGEEDGDDFITDPEAR